VVVVVDASDTSPRWRFSLIVGGLLGRGAVLDDGTNLWLVLWSQMRVSLALTGAVPQRDQFGWQLQLTNAAVPDVLGSARSRRSSQQLSELRNRPFLSMMTQSPHGNENGR
jgi:hypothetical protein